MITLTKLAQAFATAAHAGQVRKYTKKPYVEHCLNVSMIILDSMGSEGGVKYDQEVVAAALLHDVLEDTLVTHRAITSFFGDKVARIVKELTDISTKGDGNRAARKAIDRAHLAKASPEAQTIKYADMLDNLRDIVEHDEDFAKVYVLEMKALLKVLDKGDKTLYTIIKDAVETACDNLGVC